VPTPRLRPTRFSDHLERPNASATLPPHYGQDRLAKRVLEGIQDDLRAKQLIDHVRKGVADFTERKFLDDDGTLFIVKAE